MVKYRRPVFTATILTRAEQIMYDTADKLGFTIIEINGEADHIHLLIDYPPRLSIATIAGQLKGRSSHTLRQEFAPQLRQYLWGDHLWSDAYFAASSGGAPLSIIKKYIQNQARPR